MSIERQFIIKSFLYNKILPDIGLTEKAGLDCKQFNSNSKSTGMSLLNGITLVLLK